MFLWQLNFFNSSYNFCSDNITLQITSCLKSACPKMVELTLWSRL